MSASSRSSSTASRLGLDSFYKASHNLIDEGQFGAPIILTPFNYLTGGNTALEFTGNYDDRRTFSSYAQRRL